MNAPSSASATFVVSCARGWLDETGVTIVKLRTEAVVDAEAAGELTEAVSSLNPGQRPLLLFFLDAGRAFTQQGREALLQPDSFSPMPIGIAFVAHQPFWRVFAEMFSRMMRLNTSCAAFDDSSSASHWMSSLRESETARPMAAIVRSVDTVLGVTELRGDGVVLIRVRNNQPITRTIAEQSIEMVDRILEGIGRRPVIYVLRWPIFTPEAFSYIFARLVGPRPETCVAFVTGSSYARLVVSVASKHIQPVVPIRQFQDVASATAWCHQQLQQ